MKPNPHPHENPPAMGARRGFALIVTISLMILLTVIAVGMLTLSSISLRGTAHENDMSTARGNARLALLLALGELQKSAGPDQRVTAPANLVDAAASPGVTGVWESWKPDPYGSNDHNSRKIREQSEDEIADGEFVTWLASGDPAQAAAPAKPPGLSAPAKDSVTLISDQKPAGKVIPGIHLKPVVVENRGALAWTVADEGVKARMDLAAEEPLANANANAEQRKARLRAPARPQVETISDEVADLRMDAATASKLVSISQGDLQLGGKKALRPFIHDVTPYATSLPVNVADGGIKADLTRAFENDALPLELRRRHVYSNRDEPFSVADPRFALLADHYKQSKKPANVLQVKAPPGYAPVRSDKGKNIPNLAPLQGSLIAPVVTRVSVAFSLVSRRAHDHWVNTIPSTTGDTQRRNMVYLIYTPVVTVYNPYSVPLSVNNLKVTFRNLPVAFKFFRNGLAQTNNPSLLSSFHILSESGSSWDDPFSLTASRKPGSADTAVTLYPGEARVFGESHPGTANWGSMANYLWQGSLDSSRTKNVYSGSGWDYRSGYIVDWLRPAGSGRTADNKNLGVFAVRPDDRVNVEVSPLTPAAADGKFSVDLEARVGSANTKLGIYEYDYGNQARLKEILEKGNHTTIGKVTYPFKRERDWNVGELNLASPDSPLSTWGSAPKQFAIFTLGARTSHDSLFPGKPGRTSSFVQHVVAMDARQNDPALLPMEMSLLPVTNSGANTVGSIDADDFDRAFHFSGGTRGSGAIHYVSQDLPTSPPVNLADFRHANLASSGHLPLTPFTVGESLASPMVPGEKAVAPSNFGYEVVDHAWLANRSLWDGYYFSGIRNASDAESLFAGGQLPLNPRQVAMPSSGKTAKDAAAAVLAPEGWSDSAALMAVKGGFNVNSTSKSAWLAQLNSLRGLEIPVLGPVSNSTSPVDAREVVRTAEDAIFPRLGRPVSENVNASNSRDNQRRWSGFRGLDESEIDKLADAIVTEIRARGPFLSMAEFMNRRLAPSSDEMATAGALETAIRKSGVNNITMGMNTRILTENQAAQFGYANPAAAAGDTEEAASAILTQGDLVSAIGASITVRSDTFVIRTYGDARRGGNVTARARCEAVVQRLPAFVDPADAPEKVQAALDDPGRAISDLTAVNRRFGRRFEVVSFRWLTEDEI